MDQRQGIALAVGVLGIVLVVGGIWLNGFAKDQLDGIRECRRQEICTPTGDKTIEEQQDAAENLRLFGLIGAWSGGAVLFIALLTAVAAAFFPASARDGAPRETPARTFARKTSKGDDAALAELRMRYAKGELSHEEYERRFRALSGER